jgi:hypothetical protein
VILVACGGGGNATVAIVFLLVPAVIYWLAVATALRRAEDTAERLVLIVLFLVSAALGPLILLFPDNSPSLTRFIISLVVTGGVGLAVAAKWREGIAGRAVFIALAGDVLIPGTILVAFIAALLGGACLE